jgi:hypothetical protein
MIERIRDDGVLLPEQRLEQPAVGLEARGIENDVLLLDIARDRLLEPAVQIRRAADEAHRRHAEAVAVQRLLGRGNEARIIGKAEIVVGTEIENLALGAVDCDPDVAGLRRHDRPFGLPQVLRPDGIELGGNRRQKRGHGRILPTSRPGGDRGEVAEPEAREKPVQPTPVSAWPWRRRGGKSEDMEQAPESGSKRRTNRSSRAARSIMVVAVQRLWADEAVSLSGNIAFRTLFSAFPFLIFLTALGAYSRR